MFLVYVLPVWNNHFNFRKDGMCEKICLTHLWELQKNFSLWYDQAHSVPGGSGDKKCVGS